MEFSPDPLMTMMGKSDRRNPDRRYHPCIAHLYDTWIVASLIWKNMSNAKRRAMVEAMGVPEPVAEYICKVLAAIHDLGKLGPQYHKRYQIVSDHELIVRLGLKVPRRYDQEAFHTIVSSYAIHDILSSGMIGIRFSAPTSIALSRGVGGGHHGWAADGRQIKYRRGVVTRETYMPTPPREVEKALGDVDWYDHRKQVAAQVIERVGPAPEYDGVVDLNSTAIELIMGFVSYCDWTASHYVDLLYRDPSYTTLDHMMTSDEYLEHARREIPKRIGRSCLSGGGWNPDRPRSFQGIFGLQPRNMQAAAERIRIDPGVPNIIAVGAQSGGGKSKTGELLSSRLADAGFDDGITFLLPTRAQANAMLEEVVEFIRRTHDKDAQVQVAHAEARSLESLRPFIEAAKAEGGDIVTDIWYMDHGKQLLADAVIGCIDQVMMAVVRVRHHSFRLFALAGGVVIFDEIHAYDAYMYAVIDVLLTLLGRIGVSVILMSATLTKDMLRRLFSSFLGRPSEVEIPSQPCIIQESSIGSDSISFAAERSTEFSIEWVNSLSIAEEAVAEVERGGHIVAFSNTVRSSQDVADAAVISGLSPDELLLLHSRFMQKHRLADEVILMDRLGARADGRIPRHLLSTTQVGEVSLDYTNDGVITQISPVDSLLQRLGRAGRFERDLPPGRDRLVAKVGIPGGDPTVPFIKPQKYATEGDWSLAVYQEWPILATQVALLDQCSRRGGRISIPEDVEPLVELVYSSSPDQIMEIVAGLGLPDELTETWRKRLFDAHANYLKSKNEAYAKAERASIPLELSGADTHVQAIAKRGDEVAYTRLVGDSTQLVLLYSDSDDGGPFFAEEDLSDPCDPDDVDSVSTVKMLARNSLRISSDTELIAALDKACFPEKWKDHGFLKRYRLAILRHGVAIVKGAQRTYRITYTRQRGLGVER